MDLIEYTGVIRRRLRQIIAFAVLLAVLSGLFGMIFSETRYHAELFITTASHDTSETEAYRFSNYYNEFSANNFNNTIIGWMADPSLTRDAYLKAEVDFGEHMSFWQKFSAPFAAKKRQRNNVAISMSTKTDAAAKALVTGLFETLSERVKRYNQASGSRYEIIRQGDVVGIKKTKSSRLAFVGLIIGFILGIILAYIYEYGASKLSTASSAEDILDQENLAVVKDWKDNEWQFVRALSKKLGTNHAVLIDFEDKKKVINKWLSSHKLLSFPANADEVNRLEDEKVLVFYRLSHSNSEQLKRLKHLLRSEQIQAIAIDA